MRIRSLLDAVKHADRLVEVLRLSDELAAEVGRDGDVHHLRVLWSAVQSADQMTAIAAIHALAHIPDEAVDTALAEMLSDERGFVREHTAWALSSRAPRPGAIGPLIGFVVSGGFAGMLAQRTLEEWAKTAPDAVAIGLESALIGITDPAPRYRLVETLGLVQQATVTIQLSRIADDTFEDVSVRVAAVAALGDRECAPATRDQLVRLARSEGQLGEVAQLALADIDAAAGAGAGPGASVLRGTEEGLTVAQLFLHADIDSELSHAGDGDNGGIATLLVRLGDALVRDSDPGGDEVDTGDIEGVPVTRVLTLSRGEALSLASLAEGRSGHVYARVPLLQEAVQSANAWPRRIAARRGIARMIRAAGAVDVIHLRMADVGSLAALEIARAFDIPVVFTAAPDPHGSINSMDLSGSLTRESFGTVDETELFWFRARLVQRLVASSIHTVYFPRPQLREDMRELLGIDHADGGAAMTSKPLASLLVDLDDLKSHNRPRTSKDNPSSESQFKMMKYQSNYPERFASIGETRAWMNEFTNWYNHEHHLRVSVCTRQRRCITARPWRFVRGGSERSMLRIGRTRNGLPGHRSLRSCRRKSRSMTSRRGRNPQPKN